MSAYFRLFVFFSRLSSSGDRTRRGDSTVYNSVLFGVCGFLWLEVERQCGRVAQFLSPAPLPWIRHRQSALAARAHTCALQSQTGSPASNRTRKARTRTARSTSYTASGSLTMATSKAPTVQRAYRPICVEQN